MSAHRVAADLFKAPVEIRDPGNAGTIYVDRNVCVVNLDSGGAETRTLARPTRAGALLTLHHRTDGGDITLTVTGGFTEAGDTTVAFTDPGQIALFQSFETSTAGTFIWRALNNSTGAALTAQLTTITITDAAGTPDYALSALTTSSPYGLATQAEAITLLYVIQNLQVRVAELEARLKSAGILKA